MCGPKAKKNDVPLEIHHQVPVSEGGATVKENLTVVCRFCHRHHHSQVRPEDLETDFDQKPTSVDVKLVHALEEYGEMRQCEIAWVTGVSDHLRGARIR